jgi:hypothetical protein
MQYIWFLSILFAIHYLADFFVQVYTWKSNNQWVRNLITHTITYIFVMIFGVIVLEALFPALAIPYHALLGFIAVNSGLHFLTDLCTKLLTRTLRKHNELTAYVNVIALDQCIHYITLLITFGYFFVK